MYVHFYVDGNFGKERISSLFELPWKGRDSYLCFDVDSHTDEPEFLIPYVLKKQLKTINSVAL